MALTGLQRIDVASSKAEIYFHDRITRETKKFSALISYIDFKGIQMRPGFMNTIKWWVG